MLNSSLAAKALGLELQEPVVDFAGINTDSRSIKPGELFVALKGENFDGHSYCVKAVEMGAVGVVISQPVEGLPKGCRVFRVENTLTAYQLLAREYRRQFKNLTVFAITGSNGKTSTKDLLAACLSSKYRVVKTQGNFNNEIGLPKTLLSIQPDTDIAVVEMGMRGLGQIEALCKVAEPDSGLITNVGETHMELLGSMENIGIAKSEIVEELPETGFAVLNGDNKYVVKAAAKTKAKVVFYGLSSECDLQGSQIVTSAAGTTFKCTVKATGEEQLIKLPLIGEHNVYNALAAISGASCYGVSLEQCAQALEGVVLTGKRQELVELGALTFINDAYNASPASMEAAMKTLAEAKKARPGAKAIAVLADMLELGQVSQEAHRRVGQWALENGVDLVLTYGQEAALITEAVLKGQGKAQHFPSREAAAQALKQLVQKGDVVLLKGSHSMGVDKVLEYFK